MTRVSYKGNPNSRTKHQDSPLQFPKCHVCPLCAVPHPSPGLSLPCYSCASSFWPALPPSGLWYHCRAQCSRCPGVTHLRAKCSQCPGVTMFSNRYVHLLTESLSSAQDIVDLYLGEICEHHEHVFFRWELFLIQV